MNSNPPPIIDSARLLTFAHNDGDVEFTDRINLFVGEKDSMERLGEMPNLAICADYATPKEILLFFCNDEWASQGVIAFASVEEAKLKAERGYRGISKKWKESPYSNDEVNSFLRDVYDVDPNSEWWKTICSFCGKGSSEFQQMLATERATICRQCVEAFYEHFRNEGDS